MSKLRIVEWFGGIGASTKALEYLNIPHEIIDYVDIDKNSVKIFNLLNNTSYTPMDIESLNVSSYEEIDLLVAGWPCQDLSTAGKQLGLKEGKRSSLIYTTIDKIKQMKIKPKYILLENVKGLLSDKFKDDYNAIKESFVDLGYIWCSILLNAKYFDVPQSRERVYIILIRQDLPYINLANLLDKKEVRYTLKDFLDYNEPCFDVDIKDCIEYTNFYIKPRQKDKLPINGFHNRIWKNNSYSGTITASAIPLVEGKKINITNKMPQYTGKNIEVDLHKLENQYQLDVNKVGKLDISFNQDKSFIGINGVSPTLVATNPDFKNKIIFKTDKIYYRKLTARECWRLMGFRDEDINKVIHLPINQLCKAAGNSIVVNVLMSIFNELWKGEQNEQII